MGQTTLQRDRLCATKSWGWLFSDFEYHGTDGTYEADEIYGSHRDHPDCRTRLGPSTREDHHSQPPTLEFDGPENHGTLCVPWLDPQNEQRLSQRSVRQAKAKRCSGA